MRRWVGALLCLALTGCAGRVLPKSVNIAELEIIRTMAVDADGAGKLCLTVCGDLQKETTGGETRAPLLLTESGDTLFTAAAALDRAGAGRLEYGHTAECVLGEALAREGIGETVDFLERDGSVRTGTKLFLCRGRGEDALRAERDDHAAPTKKLDAFSDDAAMGGLHWPFTLRRYLDDTGDNGAALLPVLTIGDGVDLTGLCWMEDHRLGGYFNARESRGIALLSGWDQRDAFSVPLGEGPAGVRLVKSRCEWVPEFDADGALRGARAVVTVYGKVTQLPPGAVPEADLEELRAKWLKQVEALCQLAEGAVTETGADLFHLRRLLCCTHSGAETAIRQAFETGRPLKLTVEVRGEVGRTYDTDRPPAIGAEGNE